MPALEWHWARELQLASDYPAHWEIGLLMGLPHEVTDFVLTWRESLSRLLEDLPSHFVALRDGGSVQCGERSWTAVCGGGHAPGMAGLWAAGERILLGADHVLPDVVAAQTMPLHQPWSDPLSAQFAVLDRLEDLPADTLALPSHGAPFRGLRPRIAEVRAYHETKLERLTGALDEPLTVWQALPAYFGRMIRVERAFIAASEVMAHLNHLVATGRAIQSRSATGAILFSPPSSNSTCGSMMR